MTVAIGRNARFRTATAALVGLMLFGGALAAMADDASPIPIPTEKPIYADQPRCQQWTDECVSCVRGENGAAPVCSNIGPACQPKAIRCVQSEPSPAPSPPVQDKPDARK